MKRDEWDPRRGRDGRPWRRIVHEILIPGVECTYHACDCPWGREIDTTLPATHRWSGTVDHVIQLTDGGHPTDRAGLEPMHRRCNSRKNNEVQAAKRAEARAHAHTTRSSRPW